jgi:hypothetical protein
VGRAGGRSLLTRRGIRTWSRFTLYATHCSKYVYVSFPRLSAVVCGLYAVCCMLFVVCCMLYAVCCMLYAVCCMLYAVCCMLSAVCCLLYAVCSLPPCSPAHPLTHSPAHPLTLTNRSLFPSLPLPLPLFSLSVLHSDT